MFLGICSGEQKDIMPMEKPSPRNASLRTSSPLVFTELTELRLLLGFVCCASSLVMNLTCLFFSAQMLHSGHSG